MPPNRKWNYTFYNGIFQLSIDMASKLQIRSRDRACQREFASDGFIIKVLSKALKKAGREAFWAP
jgi:hypothetical protein